MKKTLFFFAAFMVQNFSAAQMGYNKPEDIHAIQEKTLIVVVEEPDEDKLKKLAKKPEELKEYQQAFIAYNEDIREAFKDTWTFSKNVEFVTPEQFEAIQDDKAKNDKYAYFKSKEGRRGNLVMGQVTTLPRTCVFNVGLTDKKKPVTELMFYTTRPNKADLTFLIQQFQITFRTRLEMKENGKSVKELMKELDAKSAALKGRILLLDEAMVDKKLVEKISEVYKGKYEITSKDKIDQVILSRDGKYAYLKMIPAALVTDNQLTHDKMSPMVTTSSSMMFMQYVIDPANGENISYISGTNSKGKTTVNEIKELAERVDGKG